MRRPTILPPAFRRKRAARRTASTLVATVLATAGCSGGTPVSPDQAVATRLSFASDPGDFIGQGRTYDYAYRDGTWRAYAATSPFDARGVNHLAVTFEGQGASWELHVQMPTGDTLHVGAVENTTRGLLDLTGNSRGCNTSTGRFAITELVFGPDHRVDRARVTFEQHCEGAVAALRGEAIVVANPWR